MTTNTKQLNNNTLNHMAKYANNLLDDGSINLHVDYDGFSALVYESDKNTIYFTFIVDFENKVFIMDTQYFNNELEKLFTESKNFNSLTVAILELTFIIETLHKQQLELEKWRNQLQYLN